MIIKVLIYFKIFLISSISSTFILNKIVYDKNQTIVGPNELVFINCNNSCIDLNTDVYINFKKISFQINIKQIELVYSFFNLYNNAGLILEECLFTLNKNKILYFIRIFENYNFIQIQKCFFEKLNISDFIKINNRIEYGLLNLNNVYFKNSIIKSIGFIETKINLEFENLIFNEILFENTFLTINIDDNNKNQIFTIQKNIYLFNNIFKESFIIFKHLKIKSLILFNGLFFEFNEFNQLIFQINLDKTEFIMNNFVFMYNEISDKLFELDLFSEKLINIKIGKLIIVHTNINYLKNGSPSLTISGNLYFIIENSLILNNNCFNSFCGLYFKESKIDNNEKSLIIFNNILFINNSVIIKSFINNDNINGNCLILKNLCFVRIILNIFSNNFISNSFGNTCILSKNYLSNIYIISSFFNKNIGHEETSCIFFEGFEFNLFNSNFTNNKLIINSDNPSSFGTIYLNSIYIISIDCNFIYNIGNIGTILAITSDNNKIHAYLNNLNFSNNKAISTHIQVTAERYLIQIENSCFFENHANESFFYFYSTLSDYDFRITNFFSNKFLYNTANNQCNIIVVQAIDSFFNFSSCEFLGNILIEKNGISGILFLNSEITTFLQFDKCLFKNNYAYTVSIMSVILGTVIIKKSIFENNISVDVCLFIIDSYSQFNVSHTLFKENKSKGALIKILGRSLNFFDNIIFERNLIFNKLGIFTIFLLSKVEITYSIFIDNIASKGIILFVMNTFFNVKFSDNIIESNIGKGSLFESNSGRLNITSCIIKNNKADILNSFFSNILLNYIFIYNQTCEFIYSYCIMKTLSKSTIDITNAYIKLIYSISHHDLILIKNSIYLIENLIIENITSLKKVNLYNIIDSNFILNYFFCFKILLNIFYFRESSIILENSYLFSNNSLFSIGLISVLCQKLLINNSIFFSFHMEKGASINLLSSNIIIENSVFTNNIAIFGGSIYSLNSNLSISNCNFTNNKAEYGGSIYYDIDKKDNIYNFILFSNYFINSSANLSGGAYFWKHVHPLYEISNYFINNNALTGNNYSSNPMTIHSKTNLLDFLINYIPGEKIKYELVFCLQDFYNQTINYNLTGKASIEYFNSNGLSYLNLNNEKVDFNKNKKKINISITGEKLSYYKSGEFKFSDILIATQYNQSIFLSIHTELIEGPLNLITSYKYPHLYNIYDGYNYLIFFKISDCPIGYIWNKLDLKCIMCKQGYYSFNKKDEYCLECPKHSICNKNGSYINVTYGFWKYDYFSVEIYECKILGACIGENICALGYSGPLCDTCDINLNIQYYKNSSNLCELCNESFISNILFVLFIVLFFLYLFYNIRINLRDSNEKSDENNYLNVILKLISDYFQLFGHITNSSLEFPDFLVSSFSFITRFTNLLTLFYPIDCFIYKIGSIYISVFIKKVILISFIGLIMPVISMCFWHLYGFLKVKDIKLIKRKMLITIGIICYTLQPNFIETYFTYSNCIQIENKRYIRKYLQDECWVGNHLTYFLYLVFPLLILWMIILPLIIFIGLKKNKQKNINRNQQNISILSNIYKFLQDGYTDNNYSWEFVILNRKYLIILLTVFQIGNSFYFNIILINIIISLFFFLQLIYSPYINSLLNKLAILSNLSIQCNSFLMLLIILNKEKYNFNLFAAIPVFIINSFFFICLGLTIIKLKKKVILKIQNRIINGSFLLFSSTRLSKTFRNQTSKKKSKNIKGIDTRKVYVVTKTLT